MQTERHSLYLMSELKTFMNIVMVSNTHRYNYIYIYIPFHLLKFSFLLNDVREPPQISELKKLTLDCVSRDQSQKSNFYRPSKDIHTNYYRLQPPHQMRSVTMVGKILFVELCFYFYYFVFFEG